jgi:predicted dehydrogenase
MATQVCDVVIVGCGCPEKSMGWYHAKQLLDGEIASARLVDIVEPWFLDGGADSPGGLEFKAWSEEVATKHGVRIHKSLADMPDVAAGSKTMALVAGRAADNPKLLKDLVAKGILFIYLEKPGATSVQELEDMAKYAKDAGAEVYMGYNKNVASFVKKARDFSATVDANSVITFFHNNPYKPEELDECFSRNSEGMLKNMCVHELCLLVTYYGVSVDSIKSVEADKDYSKCEVRGGFTDFSKVRFAITTNDGNTLKVQADRCGGNNTGAIVHVDGNEKFQILSPDDELQKVVSAKTVANPGYMPYFFLNHDDYITLKERVCARAAGGQVPDGVASIDVGVQTLKVAEYLTPILQEQLK